MLQTCIHVHLISHARFKLLYMKPLLVVNPPNIGSRSINHYRQRVFTRVFTIFAILVRLAISYLNVQQSVVV